MAGEIAIAMAGLRSVRWVFPWAREHLVPVVADERAAYQARFERHDAIALLAHDGIVIDEASERTLAMIAAMRTRMEIEAQEAAEDVREAAFAEARRHTARWSAAVSTGAGLDVSALLADDDLADLVAAKVEETAALIRRMDEDVLHRIEERALRTIYEPGRGVSDFARELREIEGLARTRARLIARDQTSKLNAAMTEFRHAQAGVTHYKWRTTIDGRERDTHRRNSGKIFAWATPPATTGHPGRDINCRCKALAVLGEEFD